MNNFCDLVWSLTVFNSITYIYGMMELPNSLNLHFNVPDIRVDSTPDMDEFMDEELGLMDIDLENAIHCETSHDCPADSQCSGNRDDIQMKNLCMCIHTLIPVKQGENCQGENTVVEIDKQEPTGIDISPHKFGQIRDNSSIHRPAENFTQTTSKIARDHQYEDHSVTMAIKVFVPLAAVIVISIIVTIVVLRHYKICHRKRKRGKNSSAVKASEDILLLDRMNFVNKNPSYFTGKVIAETVKKIQVKNIPLERLTLLEIVGEGAFGQVFKGELLSPDTNEVKHIAVKVLKEGVSNEIISDFEREVEIMSAFDHDNILKLLGIVQTTGSDAPYMVFEYMLYGDLAELLRQNDMSIKRSIPEVLLQKKNLVDISTQISNGMRYLTSQHFVHRDLATRNCLVGEGLIVKVSDFGMSRDIYTCDYYKIGGSRMLPVRWMSPEAVKWGKFTTESDIWAFGVVLWEIFNYGRQPYYGHTNEEVIRFLDESILLQKPDECPTDIYHVMIQCWKLDPKERLPFERLYKHLVEYGKELAKNTQASLETVNDYEIPI